MKTHYDKAHFDREFLLYHRPFSTDKDIHDFIERVGIKQDSGIPENEARIQTKQEMFGR